MRQDLAWRGPSGEHKILAAREEPKMVVLQLEFVGQEFIEGIETTQFFQMGGDRGLSISQKIAPFFN